MKSLKTRLTGRRRAPWIELVRALVALIALTGPAAALADPPAPSVRQCLDRVTAGVYVNSYGATDVHDDTTRFPRYPLQVAQRICGQNLSQWRTTLACMDSMTAGVYVNSYGATDVHDDTTRHPRYTADQALALCGRSQAAWKEAKQCLDGMTAGVYVNSYGATDVHDDTTRHPRYPVSVALPSCAYASQPDKQACMTNLLGVGVGEDAAYALCQANPSTQAQQCLVSFKLQGLGVLATPDEYAAARLCAQNPSSQPADFSQLQRCLSAGSTGQGVAYAGANPPPPPGTGVTPAPGAPGSGNASNSPGH